MHLKKGLASKGLVLIRAGTKNDLIPKKVSSKKELVSKKGWY